MVIAQISIHTEDEAKILRIGVDMLRREDATDDEYKLAQHFEEYVKEIVQLLIKNGNKLVKEEIITDKL